MAGLALCACRPAADVAAWRESGEAGCSLEAQGCAAIFAAAQLNRAEVVQEVISRAGMAVLRQRTSRGSTPLFVACVKGHVEFVQVLLGFHADPAAQDHRGWTCMHTAAYHGHASIVRMLLSHMSEEDEKN